MKTRRQKAPRNILYVENIQKPFWKLKHRQWCQLGKYGALIVASMALLYFGGVMLVERAVNDNPGLRVQEIHVEISGQMLSSEILRAVGVRKGDSLMRVDIRAIENRVKSIPYVAKVVVRKRLPGTLIIRVEERQPIARVIPAAKSEEGGLTPVFYTDIQGNIMLPRPGERLKPLPIISGVKRELLIEGQQSQDAELRSAIDLLLEAERGFLKGILDLSQVEVCENGHLLVRTHQDGLVRFRQDYLQAQVERLSIILQFAENSGQQVKTVDLTPERNVPVTFFN